MAKKIIIGVVAVIVLLVLAGFLMPAEVHVERSVVIDAPPAKVFPHLCSFEASQKWSPWAERDPEMTNSYEGTACTVGHSHSWSGNDQVGTGKQTITALEQDKRVETDLDFGEQGLAKAFITVTPEGEGSKVTWGFDTDMGMNPIGRWFGLFMDGMIGGDYESGLARLKGIAEKG